MTDLTTFLTARLDELEATARAATPGPWSWNGYSAVLSRVMVQADEDFWTEERLNDGHTYDHRVGATCPACGERPAIYGETATPEVRGQRFGTYWDCARSKDAYEVEPVVASVPTQYGDTSTGRHAADAEHIATHDPAYVLADVEAKRAVVALWRDPDALPWHERERWFEASGVDNCVRALTLPWRDHPDFDPAWLT